MKKRGGKGDNRPSSYSDLGESVWGRTRYRGWGVRWWWRLCARSSLTIVCKGYFDIPSCLMNEQQDIRLSSSLTITLNPDPVRLRLGLSGYLPDLSSFPFFPWLQKEKREKKSGKSKLDAQPSIFRFTYGRLSSHVSDSQTNVCDKRHKEVAESFL